MTREEALEAVPARLSHIADMPVSKKIKWIREFVDRIYDDIEKRTCKHCEHWEYNELGVYCGITFEDMEENDFCSKWSEKETG